MAVSSRKLPKYATEVLITYYHCQHFSASESVNSVNHCNSDIMVGGAVAHKRVADIQSMTWSFGEVDNTVITNPGLQLGLRYSGQDIKKNGLNGYFK